MLFGMEGSARGKEGLSSRIDGKHSATDLHTTYKHPPGLRHLEGKRTRLVPSDIDPCKSYPSHFHPESPM